MSFATADLESDLFYVGDDGMSVRRRGVQEHNDEGTPGAHTEDILVCSFYGDAGVTFAGETARALNRLPKAEAILIDVAGKARTAAEEWDHADRHELTTASDLRAAADAIEAWIVG